MDGYGEYGGPGGNGVLEGLNMGSLSLGAFSSPKIQPILYTGYIYDSNGSGKNTFRLGGVPANATGGSIKSWYSSIAKAHVRNMTMVNTQTGQMVYDNTAVKDLCEPGSTDFYLAITILVEPPQSVNWADVQPEVHNASPLAPPISRTPMWVQPQMTHSDPWSKPLSGVGPGGFGARPSFDVDMGNAFLPNNILEEEREQVRAPRPASGGMRVHKEAPKAASRGSRRGGKGRNNER